MTDYAAIIHQVGSIYQWLDGRLAALAPACRACGNCCDFEAYGHRLYVTTPELLYFKHFTGPGIKPMPSGVCPYQADRQCTVYPYRFSGCRIFNCHTDAAVQNELCEEALRRLKALCPAFDIAYEYLYLKDALNLLSQNKLHLP
ncbi:MAG: hypothetical protein LLF76_02200 [Planctomycetaceae bacterium]|nr:hypothetical protein [Planctomycetaceae bacterium]